MVVGVCHLDLQVQGVGSLKGKRQVMKSLMGRVRSRFNVSISEVGATTAGGGPRWGYAWWATTGSSSMRP